MDTKGQLAFIRANPGLLSWLGAAACIGFLIGYRLGDTNPPPPVPGLPLGFPGTVSPAPCADCAERAVRGQIARDILSRPGKHSPKSPPVPAATVPAPDAAPDGGEFVSSEPFDHSRPAQGPVVQRGTVVEPD